MLDNGFTLGGGAGLQFAVGNSEAESRSFSVRTATSSSSGKINGASIFDGAAGFVPRLLFSVGYSL